MMHPMLLASPSAQTRLTNTLTWLTAAVGTFAILASSSNLPFVKHISIMARSLLASIETVHHNKNQCIQLLEQIHTVLYGLIELHIKSDTGGRLSPAMLEQMGNFTE
ncbi:hypothetical protein DFH06DRAFT_1338544 [Mycena polygramma]|nr:hypothetical protein DFH06DRAFT_1338544 [Mycena polygramma]